MCKGPEAGESLVSLKGRGSLWLESESEGDPAWGEVGVRQAPWVQSEL